MNMNIFKTLNSVLLIFFIACMTVSCEGEKPVKFNSETDSVLNFLNKLKTLRSLSDIKPYFTKHGIENLKGYQNGKYFKEMGKMNLEISHIENAGPGLNSVYLISENNPLSQDSGFPLEFDVVVVRRDGYRIAEIQETSSQYTQWAMNSYRLASDYDNKDLPLVTIIKASHRGDVEKLRELKELGVYFNITGINNETPLVTAVENKRYEASAFLIENGVDINKPNTNGFTPLIMAANVGDLEITRLLIENGANINFMNKSGANALYYACSNAHEGVANLLVEHGIKFNWDNSDASPVFNAIKFGFYDVIKAFTDGEVDFSRPLKRGRNGLEWAKYFFRYADEDKKQRAKDILDMIQSNLNS